MTNFLLTISFFPIINSDFSFDSNFLDLLQTDIDLKLRNQEQLKLLLQDFIEKVRSSSLSLYSLNPPEMQSSAGVQIKTDIDTNTNNSNTSTSINVTDTSLKIQAGPELGLDNTGTGTISTVATLSSAVHPVQEPVPLPPSTYWSRLVVVEYCILIVIIWVCIANDVNWYRPWSPEYQEAERLASWRYNLREE